VLKPIAFWDTSALVTLCVDQVATPQALLLEKKYGIAVWWATRVEIASALAQLQRQLKITAIQYAHAREQAEGMANLWRVIMPSARIATQACLFLESYTLRAADALQLAAALEWCEGQPLGKVFITFDQRLRDAARLAGFALE
jgi:predicted nucleic acid-binding protein